MSLEQRLAPHVGWLLPAVLALMSLVLFADFLTLNKLYLFKDIGSDTLNHFYPQRALTAEMLRHGLPGWSFRQGMGQNVFPNTLGDPFAWPLYLLGPRAMAYAIAPLEIVKLLAAGGLFCALLRLRGARPVVAALVAVGYAFCATMIVGGGWWYLLSDQVVHAALLLTTYELLLQRRASWPFPIAVAVVAALNVFSLYLLGVLLVIYAVLRWIGSPEAARESLPRHVARVAGLGALGLAASAVFWLTSALELSQSPRVAGGSGLFGELLRAPAFRLGDARLYATEILRAFGSDLLGTGSDYRGWTNYLEAPMPYCGLLALLLAPQAFVAATRRGRVAFGVGAGLLLLAYVFPWLRHAVWLFTGDYFRTLSLWTSIALLLAAAGTLGAILDRGALDRRVLIATLVVLVVLVNLPYAFAGAPLAVDVAGRSIATVLLVVYAALIAGLAQPGFHGVALAGLLALVPIELVMSAYPAVNARPVVTGSEWRSRSGYFDATLDAVDLIRKQDPSFHRVEKNYISSPGGFGLNDAKVQGYRGTSSYFSFNQLDYIRFLGETDVIDPANAEQTNWAPGLKSRFVLQTMAGVKYWLYRGDRATVPMLAATYDSIDAVDDVTVLRNHNVVPLGFGVRHILRESSFRALDPGRRDGTMLRAAVIPDSSVASLAGLAALDTAAIPLPYSLTAYAEDAAACAAAAMSTTSWSDERIAGRVTSTEPRLWVFAFPCDPGWSVRVDGRPARVQRVDFGLAGVLTGAGEHELEWTYTPPLRRLGLLISAIGLVGLVGVVAAAGFRRRAVTSA